MYFYDDTMKFNDHILSDFFAETKTKWYPML